MSQKNINRPGYKHTEVGWIPNEWRYDLLGGAATVTTGGTPSRAVPEYWNGNIPWVTTSEINFNTISETNEQITKKGLDNSSAKVFPPQTLLIAMFGQGVTRGRVALLNVPAAFNQACSAILPINANFDNSFLFCYLSFRYEQIRNMGQTGTQSNLNASIIKSIPIPLPPLTEQHKIAEILSTWDRAIDQTRRLLDTCKRRKQALMQKLLTGTWRFPEFGKPVMGMEFPLGWEAAPFSYIANLRNERILPTKAPPYRCIELEHIESETGFLLGWIDSQKQKSIKNRFFEGDVIFGKLRPYLKKFHQPDFDGVCTTEIWVFCAKRNICLPTFLYYLVQSDTFLEGTNISSGTKMPRAEWAIVSSIQLPLPTLPEQEKIASILTAADDEITALRKSLERLQRQKRGLMQKLLTCEIRV